MSRGYQITWANATATITCEDTLEVKLDALSILPEDEMNVLLRDALVKDGWTRQEDGSLTLAIGDAVAVLPADGKIIQVSMQKTQEVNARSYEGQEKANEELEKVKETTTAKETHKIASQLLALEPTIRQRINEMIQGVYLEALKRKAASMGEISGIQENLGSDGTLEVTIKVRV